jgi:hypothetical protein
LGVWSEVVVTEDEIKNDLVGNVGNGVSQALVLALRSLTDWPVDAFSVDIKDAAKQTVAWVEGGSIGTLTATRGFGDHELSAIIRPLRTVTSVAVNPRFVDRGVVPHVDRAVTLKFAAGPDMTVHVGSYVAAHYRDCANGFITAVLRAVAASGPG